MVIPTITGVLRSARHWLAVWPVLVARRLMKREIHDGIEIYYPVSGGAGGSEEFASDVKQSLELLRSISPKLFRRVQQYVRRIVRFNIEDEAHYYFDQRLLILRAKPYNDTIPNVDRYVDDLVYAASMAYCLKLGLPSSRRSPRVSRLFERQLEISRGRLRQLEPKGQVKGVRS